MRRPAHVVQVRLTRDEWNLLDLLAAGRRITIEEMIRSELRFRPFDAEAPQTARRHLQIVRPELVGAATDDR